VTQLPAIDVVGIHGGQTFGPAAQTALREADVLVASVRHLAYVDIGPGQQTIELAGALAPVLEHIALEWAAGRRVAVLSSGDPGFFGIVRLLGERFGPQALVVHPAPSSVSLAFARIGSSWDDAVVVSAHSKKLCPPRLACPRSPS